MELTRYSTRLRDAISRPVFRVTLANALYSASSFLVTLLLPFLLEGVIFEQTIYTIQMILFLTSILQSTLHVTLYFFYKSEPLESSQFYLLLTSIVLCLLFLGGFWFDNPLICWLNLSSLSEREQFLFHLSVFMTCVYAYNKGLNMASKSFVRMLIVSLVAVVARVVLLLLFYLIGIDSLSMILWGMFILPFVWELVEYFRSILRTYASWRLNREFVSRFLSYASRIATISILSLYADRIFMIKMKEGDPTFAAAIAFSFGFMGVLALLYTSLSSYFLSSLDMKKQDNLILYLDKLKRGLLFFLPFLLFLSILFALSIETFYPHLGRLYSVVAFISLIKVGLFSYLGMSSLLSRVLNLLRVEIGFNVLRVGLVWCVCNLFYTEEALLWYIVALMAQFVPELIMNVIIIRKVYSNNVLDA